MKKTVGIYRSVYPVASETFITQQAAYLPTYEPTFIVRARREGSTFPTIAVDDREPRKLRRALHTLTRSPRLFGDLGGPYDLMHAHFTVDGVYALPLARRLALPLVVSAHGYDITSNRGVSFRKGSQRKVQFAQYLLHESRLQQRATGFIANSRYIKGRMVDRGYPEEKIRVNYYGIDTELFTPRDEPTGERYVLCVGRHTDKKGLDVLLTAWSTIAERHPSVSLVQVGGGPLTEELLALAHTLGIEDRVRFLGVQTRDGVLALMQRAEVFCLPSRTAASGDEEGLGVVFNEASACAVPCVATHHGGIPEVVRDGENGLLVAENDAPALADALDAVLSDQSLAQRLGQRGRALVCEEFDVRAQSVKLEQIYDEIAA
jgi:colanic acid/amylovoran biosynthesis glycosyltransferase